jgi:hypothetical protein
MGFEMSAKARIAGVRLGLTYGAGLIVLGLTIAALTSNDFTLPGNAAPADAATQRPH